MEIEFSNAMPSYPTGIGPNQTKNKSSIIALTVKIIIGLVVVALLAAIFIVLIVRFPTNNNNSVSVPQTQEQQGAIINLLIKSHERIAQLQREHEVYLEKMRQNQMNEYRQEDRLHYLIEQEIQRNFTNEFIQRTEQFNAKIREDERQFQYTIEQQRAHIMDKYRYQDKIRQDENDLEEFLDKYNLTNTPRSILEQKVLSLIRRFNTPHKSLLIKILYKENLLDRNCDDSNISSCYLRLEDADLSGIQLGKIDQNNCPDGQYNHLSLPQTNLINASFDCLSLKNANFNGANLSNASFFRSDLQNISLLMSNLNKCNFQEAIIDRTILFRSSLLGTQFQRASLVGTQFILNEGNWSDFREANLTQSLFLEVLLTGAKFDYADISESNLGSAYLENASFYKVNGYKGKFGSSKLTNANFREAFLVQSDFALAEGNRTDFSQAILDGILLSFARLEEAIFYNASMNYAILKLTHLINSNLRHVSLTGAYFELATLNGSDFSKANLNQSTLWSQDQFDNVFSISKAILPNGSIGKNKNLLKNSHPICNNSMNISEWIITNQVNTNSCVFQSTKSNVSMMIQTVDVSYYVKRMMSAGSTNILVEIDVISGKINANLYLFDSMNYLIDQGFSLFNNITKSAMFGRVSVEHRIINPTIIRAQLEIIFLEMNTTINNIHLSIEA